MSTRYRDQVTGITVTVSRYAERLIGTHNVQPFVEELMKLMDALGCSWAYVSKAWDAVEIHMQHKHGWTTSMKVKRGK